VTTPTLPEQVRALRPARPLSVDENNALAGEGTIAAALAAHSWRFVTCEHGTFAGDKWHEHTHHADLRTHDIYYIERPANYIEDCILTLDTDEPR
jgi:hypothetical protein